MKPGIWHIFFLLTLPFLTVSVTPVTVGAEGVTAGVILPLSGTHAALGHMQKNSMHIAVEEINSRGGVGGELLTLDIKDSGGQPGDARAIIDHFVKDKQYAVVLGGVNSSVATALADKCEQRRIPLVIISGSEDAITLQDYRYVFRVAPPRSRYASAALDYIKGGYAGPDIALITERSSFGDSMAWVVKQTARETGWNLSGEWTFEPGSRNFEALISETQAASPEVVFLTAFPPDGSRIIKELKERLPEAALINLVPSSTSTGSYFQCGASCDDVMNPSLWMPDVTSSGSRFREKYISTFDSVPDYHGAQAYAAVVVAAQAMRRSGAVEPEPVREALDGLSVNTPYGKVRFRDWGGYVNQNDPDNYLVRWTGSSFEVVWPRD